MGIIQDRVTGGGNGVRKGQVSRSVNSDRDTCWPFGLFPRLAGLSPLQTPPMFPLDLESSRRCRLSNMDTIDSIGDKADIVPMEVKTLKAVMAD